MRRKRLLAVFLLGAGLCFIPIMGYGEVVLGRGELTIADLLTYRKEPLWDRVAATDTDISLLRADINLLSARADYMMGNPTSFLNVNFYYDPDGQLGRKLFPEGVDTKRRICVVVLDNRAVFSDTSGTALLDKFKENLEVIYSYIKVMATDTNTDVVARFSSEEDIPLGYFYQSEYHLWEK